MMTEEEMRVAIAEKCEWKWSAPNRSWPNSYWKNPVTKALTTIDELPNYLKDLNAMHEARKVLNDVEQRKYASELHGVTNANHSFGRPENYWIVLNATAAQHAEAFCRVFWPERFQGLAERVPPNRKLKI